MQIFSVLMNQNNFSSCCYIDSCLVCSVHYFSSEMFQRSSNTEGLKSKKRPTAAASGRKGPGTFTRYLAARTLFNLQNPHAKNVNPRHVPKNRGKRRILPYFTDTRVDHRLAGTFDTADNLRHEPGETGSTQRLSTVTEPVACR